MTYCTLQDLIDRFGEQRLVQLTDKINKPATTIDAVTVAKHIGDAVSMINSYVAKRYAVPLTFVPEALTKVAVDLAWYYLRGDAVEKDDPAAIAFRDAIKWLENVSKGLIIIEGADGVALPSAGGGQVKTSPPNRVFTRTSLDSF
jgi:phage gp36-like protein